MTHLAEFNILTSKNRHRSTSACNVVINNQTALARADDVPSVAPTYPQEGYPNGIPPGQEHMFNPVSYPPPPLMERSVTLDETTTTTTSDTEKEMYKLLAKTFSDILKDNNSKLIANIIDPSGKVIVDAENLARIVALTCGVSAEMIHIEYESGEGGCCAKINPIKKIKNIKIGSLDFKLAYNEKYNNLTDYFNVSLKKIIIPVEELF